MAVSKVNANRNLAYGLNDTLLVLAPQPVISERAPTTSDKAEIGTIWVDKPNDDGYILTSIVANSATWIGIGGGSGTFTNITATGFITAGDSFTMSSGTMTVTADDNTAQVIYLHADGGTTETIDIHADQGTAVTSINIHSDVGGVTVDSGLASADAINISASDAAGGIDVDYGTGGMSVVGANGAFALETGTGAIDIGTDAAAKVITIGNITGASEVAVNSGTGGITLLSTGTGDISIDSDDALLLDSDGELGLNSSAGTINIGNDAVAQPINIGTGAAARTITIGNFTGATEFNVASGTGGITLETVGTGGIAIASSNVLEADAVGALAINSSGGAINIGDDAVAQPINIGTGAAVTRAMTIGNGAAGTSINIQAGTGGVEIDAVGIVDINSSGGTINIGNDAVAAPINVGTGAAVRNISIGNTTGATDVAVNSGTGGITLNGAGIVDMVPATDTQAAAAVTINANVGVGTFTGLTTASGASQVLTVTNSVCTAGSAILASLSNLGGNDAQMTITRVTPGAGSFTVTATNNGAAALNGNIILTFWIIAA